MASAFSSCMRFLSSLLVEAAIAQCPGPRCVVVSTGVHSSVQTIVQGVVNTLLVWSAFVSTAIFLLGAIFLVGSGGSEQWSSNGKKLMKAAVIGLAIVLSAWLMVSTAVFFIAG